MTNPFKTTQPSSRQLYEQKYNASRANLLLLILFTAINLILLVINADFYFLFSAFIPYFMTSMAMLFCGMLPDEYYTDGLEGMEFFDESVFYIVLAVSVVITLVYLATWIFSSKGRVGWMITALALFSLDTVAMLSLGGVALDSIIDLLFHIWVIYYLAIGIHAHYKLKNLPPEEEAPTLTEEALSEADYATDGFDYTDNSDSRDTDNGASNG